MAEKGDTEKNEEEESAGTIWLSKHLWVEWCVILTQFRNVGDKNKKIPPWCVLLQLENWAVRSELAPAYLHLMTAKNHKNQLFLFSCLLKCNWLLLHFSPAWLGSHLAIPGADLVQPGPVPAGGSGRVLEDPDSERWRCGVEAEEVWGPGWEVESGGRSEIYYFPVSGWRDCSDCSSCSRINTALDNTRTPASSPGLAELSKQTHFYHIKNPDVSCDTKWKAFYWCHPTLL